MFWVLIENFGLERHVFDVVNGGPVLSRLAGVETHSHHQKLFLNIVELKTSITYAGILKKSNSPLR